MPEHAIVHVEWQSTDLDRTKAFYGELFGWSFEPFGDSYLMFSTPEGGPNGGFAKVDRVEPSQSPTDYVEVTDVDRYVEAAKNAGGGVVVEKTEIPNMGWFAKLTDPDGNVVGVFQGAQGQPAG
jgi:uncharacterized protein